MKIAQVIPLSKGIGADTLTYFTSLPVSAGALVTVPLRKKKVTAIVAKVSSADLEKSEIKTQGFQMKKIEKLLAPEFFTPAFMRSAQRGADFFATSIGAFISGLSPKPVLEKINEEFSLKKTIREDDERVHRTLPAGKNGRRKLVLQTTDAERIRSYKSLIREAFANGGSVLCLTPTAEEAELIFEELHKGIENFAYILHGSVRAGALREAWNKASGEAHPVLVVTTGSFLSLPRSDWRTIIVERESSRSYKMQARPHLDIRTAAELLAEECAADFCLGDISLRTETLFRTESKELEALQPLSFRALASTSTKLIDVRKTGQKPEEVAGRSNNPWKAISPGLAELVSRTIDDESHLFIYAARRGYSPTTVCRDCGETVLCKNCRAPAVLHIADRAGQNTFECHRCGAKRSAKEVCTNCSSWRLIPLGQGVEKIAEEIREQFPAVPVFVLDADTASTERKITAIIDDFYAAPGSVMIGTELALLRLRAVEYCAVASLDSLFLVPDFRIHEKIMSLLLKCRSITESTFLIQTRMPEEPLWAAAVSGDLEAFYRANLAERKLFGYPPFVMLIKISVTADETRAAAEMEKVEKLFVGEEIYTFPAFVARAKGKHTMHALLKISPERWPDAALLAKLRSLPPYFSVRVDPENLL